MRLFLWPAIMLIGLVGIAAPSHAFIDNDSDFVDEGDIFRAFRHGVLTDQPLTLVEFEKLPKFASGFGCGF